MQLFVVLNISILVKLRAVPIQIRVLLSLKMSLDNLQTKNIFAKHNYSPDPKPRNKALQIDNGSGIKSCISDAIASQMS